MHRTCATATLSVLVALSLSGCSAIFIRAPNKEETPVQCNEASPLPWIELGALVAVQAASLIVATSGPLPVSRHENAAIGLAGLFGSPAIFLPSMSYGFGRKRQCHLLHVRDEHPPLTLQLEKWDQPGAPRVEAPPPVPVATGKKPECTDEQIQAAGVKALEAAGLGVARTRPEVESVWLNHRRGPCTYRLMLRVTRGLAGGRVIGFIRDWGCGLEPTPKEIGLLKQISRSLHEHLAPCDPTPLPDEPPLLEPVGYPRQ